MTLLSASVRFFCVVLPFETALVGVPIYPLIWRRFYRGPRSSTGPQFIFPFLGLGLRRHTPRLCPLLPMHFEMRVVGSAPGGFCAWLLLVGSGVGALFAYSGQHA